MAGWRVFEQSAHLLLVGSASWLTFKRICVRYWQKPLSFYYLWQKHQQSFAPKGCRNLAHAQCVAVLIVGVVVVICAILIFAVFVSVNSPTMARSPGLRNLLGNFLFLCTTQSQTCLFASRMQETPARIWPRRLFLS